ncbi:T9SS type A sorting domain-containing protein [Winogradskyella rapida]|uniref:T9SS type A sorting domain-containing protein n=1 Tax=Winogradskyella rapida TaxID=549701 RepID=A0ABW3KUH4_9FLAO
MKKITFLSICSLLSLGLSAQQTISFESAEGFTLGDIHGQSGWISTPCGTDCNLSTQLISNEQASDGTYSFKITPDTNYGTQAGPILGGFYDLATPVTYSDATISFDIYATAAGLSNFRFSALGEDAVGDLFNVFLVEFDWENNVRVVNSTATGYENLSTWAINTWYNVRVEVSGTNATYYLDDVEIGQATLISNYNLTSIRFIHDNYGGDAYIDNIRINNEELSVEDYSKDKVSHFYDQTTKTFNIETVNSPFTNVEIYSLLGNKVISKSLTSTTEAIDVSKLSSGVYLAKVSVNGSTETIKFSKN